MLVELILWKKDAEQQADYEYLKSKSDQPQLMLFIYFVKRMTLLELTFKSKSGQI
jgi:hypothetical protein